MALVAVYFTVVIVLLVYLGFENRVNGKECSPFDIFIICCWHICTVGYLMYLMFKGFYLLGGYIYDLYIKFKG